MQSDAGVGCHRIVFPFIECTVTFVDYFELYDRRRSNDNAATNLSRIFHSHKSKSAFRYLFQYSHRHRVRAQRTLQEMRVRIHSINFLKDLKDEDVERFHSTLKATEPIRIMFFALYAEVLEEVEAIDETQGEDSSK